MEHKPHDSEGAERFKRYAVPGTESTLKLRNGQVQLKPVSIPGLERSPGGGNGNPLQYSCLGNPMYRGTWWATVHGAAKKADMT